MAGVATLNRGPGSGNWRLLCRSAVSRCRPRLTSDSGDDPDPSLVHLLQPLGLLLKILVWDGADGVVASAALIDLARVPLQTVLVILNPDLDQ